MRRKVIGLILIMLMIPLLLPTTQAASPVDTKRHIFANCYLEATGSIDFTFQLNDLPIGLRYNFISFWPIIFNEPNVDVTVYARKNGQVLWEDNFDSGQWVLYLVGFFGIYTNEGSTIDTLMANLEGRVCFIYIAPLRQTSAATQTPAASTRTPDTPDDIYPVLTAGRYRNCYLEVSGYMHNDWPAIIKFPNMVQYLWVYDATTHVKNGLYSYIIFEKDAMIKVYDEKGGDLLWQHDGATSPLLTLIGFSGDFLMDNPPREVPYITMNGDVRFLGIRLKHLLF